MSKVEIKALNSAEELIELLQTDLSADALMKMGKSKENVENKK